MELRLGPTGPSLSAHGQAFWGVRGQCPWENFLASFVAHCESCAWDVENAVFGD